MRLLQLRGVRVAVPAVPGVRVPVRAEQVPVRAGQVPVPVLAEQIFPVLAERGAHNAAVAVGGGRGTVATSKD